MEFDKGVTFSSTLRRKQLFNVVFVSVVLLLAVVILSYIRVWKYYDFFLFDWINSAFSNIHHHIFTERSILGSFYAALFGGLFIVIVPLEAVYMSFLVKGYNPFILFFVFLGGLIISYSTNYFVGNKLNKLAKKFIGVSKFFSIKGKVNRYGGLAIFMFNVLPLPSQFLAAILGVFRYSKARFFVWFLVGWAIKLTVISFTYRMFMG